VGSELYLNGSRHVPFSSLSPELEQNSIVCMAPSKTFNLAGLSTSFIVVPNPKMRAAMQRRNMQYINVQLDIL
jgi:cystathionine beta-lyase